MLQSKQAKKIDWLLFFYSVPSRPVNNRMKIWRRLAQAGALPFKGAAYILPYSEEHYEFYQWLVSETVGMGGEAAFVHVGKIETMNNEDIIALFNAQRERDYQGIGNTIRELERMIQSIKKGSSVHNNKKLLEQLDKLLKQFEAVRRIDFFSSKTGAVIKKHVEMLQAEVKGIDRVYTSIRASAIVPKRVSDYQGKMWVTRKRPFVDRMASAWLIRKFIDPAASFEFINEKDIEHLNKDMIAFDIMGGEFTHTGDMCTFEVLARSFNIKDRQVKKIARIVHEIDVKDGKYKNPEARGIEEILTGIRRSVKDDKEALERGMGIFEMLYESKGAV